MFALYCSEETEETEESAQTDDKKQWNVCILGILGPLGPLGSIMTLLLTLFWHHARRHRLPWTMFYLLLIVLASFWIAEPIYSSRAIDTLLTLRDGAEVNFLRLFGFWGMLFLALGITDSIVKYLGWKLRIELELDFLERAYAHTMHLPIGFHVHQKAGEAIKTIDDGGSELQTMFRIFHDLVPSVLAAFVFVILSTRIEPLLAGVLLLGIVLYCGVVVFGSWRFSKLQDIANALWVKPIGRAYDAITNIFSVKSAGKEHAELQEMHRMNSEVKSMQMRINKRWAFIEAANFFMLTRILLVGIGTLLLVKGRLTLGELYFFQFCFFRVLTPFEILANIMPEWSKSMSKIRMAAVILAVDQEDQGKARVQTLKGAIEIRDLCFAYHVKPVRERAEIASAARMLSPPKEHLPAEEAESLISFHPIERPVAPKPEASDSGDAAEPHSGEVLHDISASIAPGEHVALVGHSGAGKSTIAALINRFYDPTAGAILVDGIDIRDFPLQWWRKQIGLVLQDNLMFNASILDNIRYARADASKEEVIAAAERASAHDFITNLPQQYDTLVGERGIRLSGGERQRLAIARAILKKPSLVVLDEATSALDSVTEKKVQEGIAELIKNRTAVIIAHRLSTVRSVHRIAVLDKGQLIAFAPHEELMKTCGIYREMVELQSHGLLAE